MLAHSGADMTWYGPPSKSCIKAIQKLTYTDAEGNRFYYVNGAWKPLSTAEDFAELNCLIALPPIKS